MRRLLLSESTVTLLPNKQTNSALHWKRRLSLIVPALHPSFAHIPSLTPRQQTQQHRTVEISRSARAI